MSDLTVICTNKCNYSCSWCRRKDALLLEDSVSKDVLLDKYISLLSNNTFESVSFSGGEPLLEPEFLIRAIQKTRELYPIMPIQINTNGSLLNSNLVSFFNFYDVYCAISIETKNSSYKSLSSLATLPYIKALKHRGIVKILFPNTKFSADTIELYNALLGTSVSFTLDTTQVFNITDVILIQIELQRLYNIREKIAIQRTSECTTRPCMELLSSGELLTYPCEGSQGICPEMKKQFDTPETFDYFISMVQNFRQGLL
jgi:organic radical activating enzyme